MAANLELNFFGNELFSTEFFSPSTGVRYQTVRGKTEGAWPGRGTFQWTLGVQALCLFFLSAKKSLLKSGPAPIMFGEAGSAASTIDYAISKEPVWLIEMFGMDSQGRSILQRLVKRTNSNRKRPGPVMLNLEQRILPADRITVVVNGEVVTSEEDLDKLRTMLAANWR